VKEEVPSSIREWFTTEVYRIPRELISSRTTRLAGGQRVDEGRPLEPTCRSRTQIAFRCCGLTDVVVSGEGKGPEAKFGSDDFQEEDRKGTTVIVSKSVKMISKPR